jgi:signal transduction histidine kinase/ActR/RegA family two-component response regulator
MPKEIPIENRKIILSYISDNPGSHQRRIARDLGVSLSTLRYHLECLEKTGEVICQKQNNLKVYFLSDKLKPHEKMLIPILQQKRYQDIILTLIDSPGLTPSQIAEKLSISNSSASKHINWLEGQEVLFHRRSGREKNYFVNDEIGIVELMTKYKKFVADVGHGVRTPMNTIMGMTSLLLEEDISPKQKDYIEAIRKSGEAMMVLINDIFDLSKTYKNGIVLDHQLFNLRGCIEESLELVSAQAVKKGLNMVFAIKYGTPDTIVGDHGKLRHVLINLLSNAVKFTNAGEIDISISSKDLGDNKCQISFAIKDTGIGMPKDKIDQIFQPTGQIDIDISQIYDNAGLGLPISKRLVELMGGAIWAESEVGSGSTFYFTIEANAVQGMSAKLENYNKPIENFAERYPLRILIAEDDPYNQKVLLEMLEKMGYKADAVADGTEVLKALEIQPHDLILMDIKMPKMDGIKATHEVRKRWPDNGPKIIAITAYAMPGDKERFLGAGMDDYIAKPIAIDNLALILSKYQPSKGSL